MFGNVSATVHIYVIHCMQPSDVLIYKIKWPLPIFRRIMARQLLPLIIQLSVTSKTTLVVDFNWLFECVKTIPSVLWVVL